MNIQVHIGDTDTYLLTLHTYNNLQTILIIRARKNIILFLKIVKILKKFSIFTKFIFNLIFNFIFVTANYLYCDDHPEEVLIGSTSLALSDSRRLGSLAILLLTYD